MQVDTAVLSTPVAQGVRLVALGFLEDAHEAGAKLAQSHDPDALHDFRVAVRRLRSWIRAFDEAFADSVKKKDRRCLRDIARATNLGRDTDVQLAWLAQAAKGFRRKRRQGADWLAAYLRSRQQSAGNQVDTGLVDSFEQTRVVLVERLSTYEQRVEFPHAGRTLASAIADRVMPHAADLALKLAAVHTVHDESEAHEARIAAKRLRYLIEPATESVHDGRKILSTLKSLQDELGALHDAHVMGHELAHALEISAATEAHQASAEALGHPTDDGGGDARLLLAAPRDGLLALAKRVRSDAREAFNRVHDDWLEGRISDFEEQLAKFTERLGALHE
jgi:CHAD domain-containing protein